MAASARTVTARAAQLLRTCTPKASSFTAPVARRNLTAFAPRRPAPKAQQAPKNSRFASTPSAGGSKTGLYASLIAVAGLGGGAYYLHSTGQLTEYFPFLSGLHSGSSEKKAVVKGADYKPTFEDYQEVYNEIAELLESNSDYDDGSYGPVLLRLAWHASGTYDKETKTGGSNGATMRFAPESDHGANAGLKVARDLLEPLKQKHPWISYSDLWILGGVCAIQEMQGPIIPYRPGRSDRDVAACTPDGRLPDASKNASHLRSIFGRMGFDDREIVALSGGHALGRCHTDRSGFTGPWTFSPTVLTNDFFKLLLEEKWQWKKWNGPKQYEDKTTKSLMMLPTDMDLVKDKEFRKHVERYAKDESVFFNEFRDVIVKLFELGVPFKQEERWTFKRTTD
ncbi:heme peroxidase [Kalaharituber pfeilii]|nr:heme peroxidase [Kalaharituber pfeilii]